MTENKRPYNGIVYLGAGDLRTLRELSELADVLYLVEERQGFIENLRQAAVELENVSFIERVVSATGEETTYYEYNLPWASGLKLPTVLSEIYPGLRKVAERGVESLSIGQLIYDCDLDSEKCNVLIIDSRGMELELLEVLAPEQAYVFEDIIIYTPKESAQDDIFRLDALIDNYKSIGYERLDIVNIPIKKELQWQTKVSLHLSRIRIKDMNNDNIIKNQQEEVLNIQARLDESEKKIQELQVSLQGSEDARKILAQQLEECLFRDNLVDQEIIKAEAQIELIKDILIRDKAF